MPSPAVTANGAYVVVHAGLARRDEIREAIVRLARWTADSAAAGCARSAPRSRALRRRRTRCRHRRLFAGSSAITPFAVSQRPSMMRLSIAWPSAYTVARRLADDSIVEDRRKWARQFPGLEERSPVDVARELGEIGVAEFAAADERRPRRHVVLPVGVIGVGARGRERDQRRPLLAARAARASSRSRRRPRRRRPASARRKAGCWPHPPHAKHRARTPSTPV